MPTPLRRPARWPAAAAVALASGFGLSVAGGVPAVAQLLPPATTTTTTAGTQPSDATSTTAAPATTAAPPPST
ncbi:MAG TPA: hypothetical protein VM242_02970, partial [Acidimicrobiales bacterium]|nr:hypothetical protein [Acidimicrobiales bacterium]